MPHAATNGDTSSGSRGPRRSSASTSFRPVRVTRDGDGISMPIGRPSPVQSTDTAPVRLDPRLLSPV